MTLQSLIDSNNNTTVVIPPGTYDENIVISGKTNLVLIGKCVTLSPTDGVAVTIQDSTGVKLSGFTIKGPLLGNPVFGIQVIRSRVTICNNVVKDIRGEDNGFGIAVEDNSHADIIGNVIENYQRAGILVARQGTTGIGTSFCIKGNQILTQQNSIAVSHGIQVSRGSLGTIIENKIVGNSFRGIQTNAGGIVLFEEKGVKVEGNYLYKNDYGVNLTDSSENWIRSNIFRDSIFGNVRLENSPNNQICENRKFDVEKDLCLLGK